MLRSLLLTLCVGGLVLTAASCGGDDCQSACDKIYDQCKTPLNNTTKQQCVDLCGKQKNPGAVASCVMKAGCTSVDYSICFNK